MSCPLPAGRPLHKESRRPPRGRARPPDPTTRTTTQVRTRPSCFATHELLRSSKWILLSIQNLPAVDGWPTTSRGLRPAITHRHQGRRRRRRRKKRTPRRCRGQTETRGLNGSSQRRQTRGGHMHSDRRTVFNLLNRTHGGLCVDQLDGGWSSRFSRVPKTQRGNEAT